MVESAKIEKDEEEGVGLELMKPNGGDRQFEAVGDQGWAGLGRLRLGFGARSEELTLSERSSGSFRAGGPILLLARFFL